MKFEAGFVHWTLSRGYNIGKVEGGEIRGLLRRTNYTSREKVCFRAVPQLLLSLIVGLGCQKSILP